MAIRIFVIFVIILWFILSLICNSLLIIALLEDKHESKRKNKTIHQKS